MPSAGALESYYSAYYTNAQYEKCGVKVTLGNPRRMGRHLSKLLGKIDTRGCVRILDLGGGDGTVAVETAKELLDRAGADRVDITVVDYSPNQTTLSDQRLTLQSVLRLEDLPEEGYHLVIASAVIEHIPDAPRIMEQVLSRVRPGGMLYVRTPQVRSFVLLARALNLEWDFTFPAHVYDLGQAFWDKYFAAGSAWQQFAVLSSKPSLVEASFAESPLRALLAYLFKMPWYFLGANWGFVGGWEIAVTRKEGVENRMQSNHASP
jgi:SAM-dependent methyltransferase